MRLCRWIAKAEFKLCLAGLAGGFAEEDVVIGVGVERGIEVFEVNGGVGESPGVTQPTEIVAKEEPVHGGKSVQRGRGCQHDCEARQRVLYPV
jgi:hypothetical protein